MKNIAILFIICFFTRSIEAQIVVEKQLKFEDRITSASIYSGVNGNDTIISLNPNPIEMLQEKIGEPNEPQKTNVRSKSKPEYVVWGRNKKVLDSNETVIGIYQNKIITSQISGTEYILRTSIVLGKEFKRKAQLKIKKVQFDNLESIYNPEGKMYVLYYQNSFDKKENKKLVCYDVDLKPVFSYAYKYKMRVAYYFFNADSFCIYEAEADSHKVSIQLISISLKKKVLEKDFRILQDFHGLYDVSCLTTKSGFIITVNENKYPSFTVHIHALNFAGDTLWKTVIDNNLTEALYITKADEVQFLFCSMTNTDGPYEITLSADSGKLVHQEYLNAVVFKDHPKEAQKKAMLYNQYVPINVQSGYFIIPFYYFSGNQKEIYTSVFYNGNTSTNFTQSVLHMQIKEVIPINGELIFVSDKKVCFAKL
jgi:hypothetical protein